MTKITQANSANDQVTKNILIIGKTGNGKSTLANVLTNTSSFAESSGSTSQTKSVQAEIFTHNEQTYQVIDTLGLSDTSLTEKEVLFKIAEIAEYLQDGNLCQVLFVIDKRISKEEQEVYRLLQEVILADNDTKELVTLVRSNFVKFANPQAVAQDLAQIKQQPVLAEILANSRGILHVNNPSTDEDQNEYLIIGAAEARRETRQIVLNYLADIPNHQVETISDIYQRVANYHSEQEQLQLVITSLQEQQQQLQIQLQQNEERHSQQLQNLANAKDSERTKLILQYQREQLAQKKKINKLEEQLEQAAIDYQELQQTVTTLREEKDRLAQQLHNHII
jgi:ribosome biogenesis GTPase A